MVDSQKWLGEGAKGLLSPGSENGVAPVQNGVAPVLNGFRMVQKTLGRLLLPELKLPFAPSPNHFWEFTIFGLSSRTFGLQHSVGKSSDTVLSAAPQQGEICTKPYVFTPFSGMQLCEIFRFGHPNPGECGTLIIFGEVFLLTVGAFSLTVNKKGGATGGFLQNIKKHRLKNPQFSVKISFEIWPKLAILQKQRKSSGKSSRRIPTTLPVLTMWLHHGIWFCGFARAASSNVQLL